MALINTYNDNPGFNLSGFLADQPQPTPYQSPTLQNMGMTEADFLASLQPGAGQTPTTGGNPLAGIQATDGGRATIGGQTFVAQNGQWVAAPNGGGFNNTGANSNLTGPPQGTSPSIQNPFGGVSPYLNVTGTQFSDAAGNNPYTVNVSDPGGTHNANYATEAATRQLAQLLGLQVSYLPAEGINPLSSGIWGLVNAQGEVTPAAQVARMVERGDTLNQVRQYLGYSPTAGGGGFGTGVIAPGSIDSGGTFTPNPNGNSAPLPYPGQSVGAEAPVGPYKGIDPGMQPSGSMSTPANMGQQATSAISLSPWGAPYGTPSETLDQWGTPFGDPNHKSSSSRYYNSGATGKGWTPNPVDYGWTRDTDGSWTRPGYTGYTPTVGPGNVRLDPFGYGGSFAGFAGTRGWGKPNRPNNASTASDIPWGATAGFNNQGARPTNQSSNSAMPWYSPWR